MNLHRANQIAIQLIEAEIKKLAVNANLEDLYHIGVPACIAAAKRRAELREAVQVLKAPQQKECFDESYHRRAVGRLPEAAIDQEGCGAIQHDALKCYPAAAQRGTYAESQRTPIMVDVTQFALFPAAVPADLIARAARVNPAWRLVMECDEIALHGNGAVAAWKDAEDCRVWLSKQTVKKDDDDND